MAYELVAEVLDHAPTDLAPSERLVMVVIAEYVLSTDYTRGNRSTSRPAADVARRAGVTISGLKQALQRLAKRGLDMRVPLLVGKDGRPVYAMPGRSSTYQVPPLAAATGGACTCDSCISGISTLEVIPKGTPHSPLNGHRITPKGASDSRLGGSTQSPGGSTQSPGDSTQPPNRVPGSVNPGPRTRPRTRTREPAPTVDDTESIIEEMHDHAGVVVDIDHATRIWRDVLTRAKTLPQHPLSYVLRAIRTEPHRYQPTPTPPPPEPPRQLPLVAAIPTPERRAHLRTHWKTGETA